LAEGLEPAKDSVIGQPAVKAVDQDELTPPRELDVTPTG
jgi:hypothetical protein